MQTSLFYPCSVVLHLIWIALFIYLILYPLSTELISFPVFVDITDECKFSKEQKIIEKKRE